MGRSYPTAVPTHPNPEGKPPACRTLSHKALKLQNAYNVYPKTPSPKKNNTTFGPENQNLSPTCSLHCSSILGLTMFNHFSPFYRPSN